MNPTLLHRTLFLGLVLTAFLAPVSAPAQDDMFDIPGVDDSAPAASEPVRDASPPPARDSATSPGAPASPAPRPAPEEDATLFTLIAAGGWAMWILGALSVSLVALGVYMTLQIRIRNFTPEGLEQKLATHMKALDVDGAVFATQENNSVLAESMHEGFQLIYDRGIGVINTDSISDVISDAAIRSNRHRAKLVGYFSTIAQAAPMVGLLGTVSGMIKAFGKLGQEGMGDPSGLAANISEALVTTATGLIVALPAIFLYSLFRDQLQERIAQTEDVSSGLVRQMITAYQDYQEQRKQD